LGAKTSGNIIVGNYTGTDVTGKVDLGNQGHGIAMELGAFDNLVQGNVSSGNGRAGVCICDWGSSYNTVIGNLIGTDASGSAPIPNDWIGVFVGMGASFNRIGGPTPEERNVISGNNTGVDIGGPADVGNLVMGNYIGTDITGTRAVGNVGHGLSVSVGERVFIGGLTEGERNVISGNGMSGVSLGVDFNWVAGNYIGTDFTGKTALGNNHFGVSIDRANQNAVQANVVVGNTQAGIRITDGAGNVVFHNSLVDNRYNNGNDDTGLNLWDHEGRGNYWGDYQGADANGDGIGDTPHPVPPSGVDRYPLMKPEEENTK
jgi:titin